MRVMLNAVRSGLSSRNVWKASSIWFICLLYVLFQGGKTSFMLFTMINVLALYWIICSIAGVKRVRGQRSLSLNGESTGKQAIQAGSQVEVKLKLQLPIFIMLPYLIVSEKLYRHNGDSWKYEDSIVPRLGGHSELIYQTPQLERGKYSFRATECRSKDIFGLLEHEGSFQTEGEFYVLPRTIFIPRWQLFSHNSRYSGPETTILQSRRETTQINGVRDYIYGDRISRIHWNATAKTGSWKSKEFERESIPKSMIVLDAHAANYINQEQFELAVSTVASLLEYGGRERINMGLCILGKEVWGSAPTESQFERQQMLHQLVDISPEGAGNYKARLEQRKGLFPVGAFFIIVTPLADEPLFEMLRWAKGHQMTPYHIHIGRSIRIADSRAHSGTLYNPQGVAGIKISALTDLPVLLGGG
ncbi:DUF58 domain-containing protein [Paenibacillus sp. D2_2]|uniref:DUF58 domain-containing protein n=1 Tax=Paenibacillus sp. D2_2 TaxID=3073092 RepID=UPI002814ABF9|nr:DUF58 domain-containing protein [Paenibacillus sp. D2_2]WMT42294.1 DUF58 domain-containing protein [Paenibacillus sp. D2_2]